MNERIRQLKDYIFEHHHHPLRRSVDWQLAGEFAAGAVPPVRRRALALSRVLSEERPCFLPGERIAFLRTVSTLPALFTEAETRDMKARYAFSEQGVPFNFTPDYGSVISQGLDALRRTLCARSSTRWSAPRRRAPVPALPRRPRWIWSGIASPIF